MGKRRRITIAVAGIAVVLVTVGMWAVLRPSLVPDTLYKGKPLSDWLTAYSSAFLTTTNLVFQPWTSDAGYAVQLSGTNAIPLLLQLMRSHDPPWKTKLFAWGSRVPWLKIHLKPKPDMSSMAAVGFSWLGDRGHPAVPSLIQILKNDSWTNSRIAAAGALGGIGPDAAAAVLALAGAAINIDGVTRQTAYRALGQIHAHPEIAVPVLIQGLQDRFSMSMNSTAAMDALGKFGREAAPAVPALLSHTTTNFNLYERRYAMRVLGVIHANPDVVVPALAELLRDSGDIRMEALDSLGQFGPEAKAVVPKLVAMYNDMHGPTMNPYAEIYLPHIEGALKEIDPDTYAKVVADKTGVAGR